MAEKKTGSSGESKAPAGSIISANRKYVDRMLADVPDMKILLMDDETTQMVAMIYSQTEILRRAVFLTEKLRNTSQHGRMMHLKCVVFVRPTEQNLQQLERELADPHYSEYYVYFSNILPRPLLQNLARADKHEVIRSVQELYLDTFAVNHDMFTLNLPDSLLMSLPRDRWDARQSASFDRCCDGVAAALLALKWKPQIRFQAGSPLAESFARKLQTNIMQENSLFTSRNNPNPTLLVLDRRNDPVTPLLTQWTYQAMVHELIGMGDNRVDMSRARNVRKDLKEVTLSCIDDDFFAEHMYANFGDLGTAIKELLASYQRKYSDNAQIQSIEDMQNFVERYPQFRALSNNVSKHVAVVGELSRYVSEHNMMDQSKLEQELACTDDHGSQLRELKQQLANPALAGIDALRLVMLYALRYETRHQRDLQSLKAKLSSRAKITPAQVALVDTLLSYAGSAKRDVDLYGNKTLLKSIAKSLSSGLAGVENVYTQHKPLLAEILEQLSKGKLATSHYPFAREGNSARSRSNAVFVFILGGVTFEEAAHVAELNRAGGPRIVLGGSHIHNSNSFLQELGQMDAMMSGGTGPYRR